jgi:uncharacterized membrane protein
MPATRTSAPATPRAFARGLARAFAGALIFGLPMLMTAELWELGARLDRLRLALLVLLVIPLLVGVAHRVGFEPSFGWREDLRDAAIALPGTCLELRVPADVAPVAACLLAVPRAHAEWLLESARYRYT